MAVAAPAQSEANPAVSIESRHDGRVVVVTGNWTLRRLVRVLDSVRSELKAAAAESSLAWNLDDVQTLDTTGALLLWQAWERRLPARCQMPARHRRLLEYWLTHDAGEQAPAPSAGAVERTVGWLATPARATVDAAAHWLEIIGRLLLDTGSVLRHPRSAPWRDVSATIFLAGARALPITGLVGVMVGIVVAYLSALQLQTFGADQYIVDMLGYAVIRELGPLIGAIIVAGRSGSSMTAQIGVMRLAQELDAMTALGMSISKRLIWPRVTALILIMPAIVLWTVLAGLAGGIAAARITLSLGLDYFVTNMPDRVPIENLWIALGKALVFGLAVGLTSAHYGLRIKPNTRDLGAQTTRAVVVAITLVILIDAAFAVVLQEVGF